MARNSLVAVVVLCAIAGGALIFDATLLDTPSQSDETKLTGTLALGLTATGLTDPGKLTDAHDRILTDESFTYHGKTVLQYSNGTLVRRSNTTIQAAHNNTQFRFTEVYSGHIPQLFGAKQGQFETWSNGNRTLALFKTPRQHQYQQLRDHTDTFGSLTNNDRLYVFFNGFTITSIEKVNNLESTTQLYRLHSTNLSRPSLLTDQFLPATVDNGTFSAVVDSWGMVHRYQVTATGDYMVRLCASKNLEPILQLMIRR
ncbi:hypothetical protein ACFFQF_23735 [Haladaptatus pallidirubidus]|uniref:hypothetical protein n=1 Tax=Haladaptatus pallidirubidus TaxID=1008152 RepID=UPI001D0F6F19|nr:hypothetical protein [Haladaptatus pallidirubidus]